MIQPLIIITVMVVLLLVSGCTQKQPIYRWGVYESLLYDMYTKPGKADPGTQVGPCLEYV